MSVIIAKNQTASVLTLNSIPVPNNQIPSSGQVTLSDYATLSEIQESEEIDAFLVAGDIILNVDGADLTVAESRIYGTPLTVASLSQVDSGTDSDIAVSPYTLANSQMASDVTANNSKVSFPEAPSDGKEYARKDSGWEEITIPASDALPVIVLKSTDDTQTFSRPSPLTVPWNAEKANHKDSAFGHSTTTNNSRITVQEDGTYQFGGTIRVLNTSSQRTQPRITVKINGIEQDWNLASGYIRNSGSASDYWSLAFVFEPQKLVDADYIELVLTHESSNPTTFTSTFIGTDSSFWGIKLQGSKGEKGDTGSGSTVDVEKNSVSVGSATVLDFQGNMPVTESSGQVSVEIGNYAHSSGITQMPDSQILRYTETGGAAVEFHDFDPGSANALFLNPGTQDRDFTGIVAPASGVNRIIFIVNTGTNKKLKFKDNDNGSVASNRFLLPDGADFDLVKKGSVQFVYDHNVNRWVSWSYY